jgi:hypothetical protein
MGSACMPRHFLTARMESWGFIKPSVQNKAVHMGLSHHLSFQLRRNLGGLHGGYHRGILSHDHGGFTPTTESHDGTYSNI